MLTLRKYRTKIPIKKLISICLVIWGWKDSLGHFNDVLRDHLLWFLCILLVRWNFFFNLEFWRDVLFETHCSFAINFFKLRFFRYFLVLCKKRIFRLPKLFLKDKFAAHKELASNYDVQKTIFIRVNITMFIHMGI